MVFLSSVESNSASPAKGRGEPAFLHDVHKVRAYFDRDRELFNGPIKVMLLIFLYANLEMADCRRWSLSHHHTGGKDAE